MGDSRYDASNGGSGDRNDCGADSEGCHGSDIN